MLKFDAASMEGGRSSAMTSRMRQHSRARTPATNQFQDEGYKSVVVNFSADRCVYPVLGETVCSAFTSVKLASLTGCGSC